MEPLIEKFLEFMKTERAAAENTIDSYRRDLGLFLKFCNSHPKKLTLIEVDPEIVQDYLEWLKKQILSNATISRRFACLRSFFGYLKIKELIKENPVKKIAISREGPGITVRALTDEEIESLLEIPAKLSTPEIIRDLAIIEVLLATGIRLQELVSLDVEMVNVDPGFPAVTVHRKGREIEISLPPRVAQTLKRYLEKVRPELAINCPKEKALFLNRWRGKRRLTRQGVWIIIRKYARLAGLKVTPRALRYSFAAQQLACGTSSEDLQRMLGHVQQSTTTHFREKLQAKR